MLKCKVSYVIQLCYYIENGKETRSTMTMKIVNPTYSEKGLDPTDEFYALDDNNTPMGYGYIMPLYQPDTYPDQPCRFFFEITGHENARYILLGAIMGKAGEYARTRGLTSARLYTQLDPATPNGHADQVFYSQNGFDMDETECWVELGIPYGDGQIPMSFVAQPIPLNTYEEQNALIQRLLANGIDYVDEAYLNRLQHMPHFLTLGLYRQMELIGEVIMAGQGQDCEVIAIYILQGHRGQGFSQPLLHRAMAWMASEGVTRIVTRTRLGSHPQRRLVDAFNGRQISTITVFPGIDLT